MSAVPIAVKSGSGGGREIKRVVLGGPGTYDVTSYDGWEDFTENNFGILFPISVTTNTYNYWGGDQAGNYNRTVRFSGGSIYYNNITGKVTFTCPSHASDNGAGQIQNGSVSASCCLYYLD